MNAEPRQDAPSDALVDRIVETPGTCGGRPRIAGTRIRVQDLVGYREDGGMTIEELLEQFPQLTRADVDAAQEYYLLHKSVIDRQMRDDLEFCIEMMQRQPPSNQEKYDRLRDDPDADPELIELLRESIEAEVERLAELKEELRLWKAADAANDSISS